MIFLSEKRHFRRIHPRLARDYTKSRNLPAKIDKIDVKMLAEFAQECRSYGREEYLRYKGEIVINHFRSPFLGLLYGVGCVEWIFCLYLWFCRGKLPWLRLGSWGLVYGGLAVAILGGNTTPDNLWQTQRLISPILPVFYLLIAWEVDTLWRFWQQRKPSF